MNLLQLSASQDVNWWTVCGLLVGYCDVFISCLDSHSDGTHSLQRIHWESSDVMLNFSKSVPDWGKLTHLHVGWSVGEQITIFGWTFPLIYGWGTFKVTVNRYKLHKLKIFKFWSECNWSILNCYYFIKSLNRAIFTIKHFCSLLEYCALICKI